MIQSLYPLFQKWCEKGCIYIISDTHFEDKDCKFMDNNWLNPIVHLNAINKVIHKQDTLIHLGDVGNPEYIDKIKVIHKVLITGNHDRLGILREHFNEVFTGPLFIADRILLSHEPIYGFEGSVLNIHGHNHSGLMFNYVPELDCYSHINLASNICHYMPYNLGKGIKTGHLKNIQNYHRKTIDNATENSLIKKGIIKIGN